MAKTLLIDANSIFYAAQHATKLNSGGMETQAVFGAVKMARELRVLYPEFKQVWCHDSRATWRFDLHPGYKAGRSDTPEKVALKKALDVQRPFIHRAFASLGVRQITVDGYEADDTIGYLSATLAAVPDSEVGIISGDQDLCQLVRKNVFWRDMRDDSKIITLANLMDKTGYPTPYAFLEGKCLTGDTSDKIPGVGGIGEGGAPEFIAEFGSVREFWRRCDAGEFIPTKKPHLSLWKGNSPYTKEEWAAQQVVTCEVRTEKEEAKLKKDWMNQWPGQGRLIFARNFRLMQLLRVPKPVKTAVNLDNGRMDMDAFAEVCAELSFLSILKNIETFAKQFKDSSYEVTLLSGGRS